MDLTAKQQEIYTGKRCPYCNGTTKVVSEEFIYGKSYKNKSMICCVNYPKCNAYCGTHEENGSSLGRLADSTLRQYKKVAHSWFDQLWKDGELHRNECYLWLSKELNTPLEYTHIGMFNIETCKKIIKLFNEKSIEQIKQDVYFVVNEYKCLADYESMRQDNLWK